MRISENILNKAISVQLYESEMKLRAKNKGMMLTSVTGKHIQINAFLCLLIQISYMEEEAQCVKRKKQVF